MPCNFFVEKLDMIYVVKGTSVYRPYLYGGKVGGEGKHSVVL